MFCDYKKITIFAVEIKIKAMRFKQLLTLLALCVSLGVHAQMGKYFTTDNQQLSSSYVTQVYLDRDGFLWVTTRNGINRYDGYLPCIQERKRVGQDPCQQLCELYDAGP